MTMMLLIKVAIIAAGLAGHPNCCNGVRAIEPSAPLYFHDPDAPDWEYDDAVTRHH